MVVDGEDAAGDHCQGGVTGGEHGSFVDGGGAVGGGEETYSDLYHFTGVPSAAGIGICQ